MFFSLSLSSLVCVVGDRRKVRYFDGFWWGGVGISHALGNSYALDIIIQTFIVVLIGYRNVY
jgi:hypothetical protein